MRGDLRDELRAPFPFHDRQPLRVSGQDGDGAQAELLWRHDETEIVGRHLLLPALSADERQGLGEGQHALVLGDGHRLVRDVAPASPEVDSSRRLPHAGGARQHHRPAGVWVGHPAGMEHHQSPGSVLDPGQSHGLGEQLQHCTRCPGVHVRGGTTRRTAGPPAHLDGWTVGRRIGEAATPRLSRPVSERGCPAAHADLDHPLQRA